MLKGLAHAVTTVGTFLPSSKSDACIMVTGLEIAALVLAIFPIVISGLEHYGSGLRSIKEWIKFDAEFTLFMNALCRQQIFFRQNMEILLSSVVESDYDMARMLDDPHDKGWQDLSVETRLRARLSGSQEYECYMAIVWTILQVLEKLQRKLKLTDDAPVSVMLAPARWCNHG